MAELQWDQLGERLYETGIDRGVLYIPDEDGDYTDGVAWNGLTTITESPSGADATPLYADNIKYLNLFAAEQFGATINAFCYPDEFCQFDGLVLPSPGVAIGQQPRKRFGLAYRSIVGNDIEGEEYGYKIHLIYGATAAPAQKAFKTVNDKPEAIDFSWVISTVPVTVEGYKPTATMVIDSTIVDSGALAALEAILYGTDMDDPRLPLPAEVIALFANDALATDVDVTGDVDSINITGTTANYLFTVKLWDGDSYEAVVGGTAVNEAAAEALTLANGIYQVTLTAADGYYVPADQQDTFVVDVT